MYNIPFYVCMCLYLFMVVCCEIWVRRRTLRPFGGPQMASIHAEVTLHQLAIVKRMQGDLPQEDLSSHSL